MESKTVKLRFKGQVHFGDGRLSDSRFTCDAATLFSAMYIEAMGLGLERQLLDAARAGELTISDAFPYIGETLYLPKPMVYLSRRPVHDNSDDEANSRARKAAKKIDFIASDAFVNFLSGDFDPVEALENACFGTATLQTKVNLERKDTVDARPYHVGGFSFLPDAGIYFFMQGSFDIEPVLSSLAFSGLGGKRAAGFGRFDYEIVNVAHAPTGIAPHEKTRHMLLSTATPKAEELDEALLADSRYRLVRRGGFVQSTTHGAVPQKKRDLYEFVSGSVFTHTFEGDVFDVNDTPGAHPVYRYARAMWLEV